jgi:hypothetical protein
VQDNLYILAQYCKFLPLSWYTPDFISILLQQLKKFKDNNLKDEKAQITLSSILFLFSLLANVIKCMHDFVSNDSADGTKVFDPVHSVFIDVWPWSDLVCRNQESRGKYDLVAREMIECVDLITLKICAYSLKRHSPLILVDWLVDLL